MRTKVCRDCGKDIVIVRRAVGPGHDALERVVPRPELRQVSDCRIVIGAFSWREDDLKTAIEALADVPHPAWSSFEFDWRTRHRCTQAAVA